MRIGGALLIGAIAFVGLMSSVAASPTCSTIKNFGPAGTGIVNRSQITAGYCVLSGDKLYGSFDLQALPTTTVLIFNINLVGSQNLYQLSFDAPFRNGHSYAWSYEVAVSGAIPGVTIVSTDADFTQVAGGPSILKENLTPGGVGAIHEIKTGPIVVPGSVLSHFFSNPVTDVQYNISLVDNGTISSVTNTVAQSRPRAPEPLSLSLVGAGFAVLLRRRRKK